MRTSPSTGKMTGAVVWVTPLDDSTFAKTSPFAIADEIRRITGEVEAAKPTHTGSLKVKFATAEQATSFALTEAFMGIPVTCTTSQQDMVEAVAFVESLATLPEKTILKELKSQGAIGVLRLHPKNGKTSTGLRFRFSGTKHLASITAGFQKIPLRTWQSIPMLCRTCADHGHTAKTCRSGTARCLRCAGPHATDACKSTEKRCPHCGGPHAAWERSCPAMKSLFKHGKTPQDKKTVGSQTDQDYTNQEAGAQQETSKQDAGTQVGCKMTDQATDPMKTTAADDQPRKDGPRTEAMPAPPTVPPPAPPPRPETRSYTQHRQHLNQPSQPNADPPQYKRSPWWGKCYAIDPTANNDPRRRPANFADSNGDQPTTKHLGP